MKMRHVIIRNHIVNQANLIEVKKNDRVLRLEEYIGNPIWKNWVYCIARDTLKEGWIPREYLRDVDEESILLEDYSSRELEITVGEVVQVKKTVNSWAYCVSERTADAGWVPVDHMEKIER